MKTKKYFENPFFKLISVDQEDLILTSSYGWGDPDSDLLIEDDEWGKED